MSDMTRNNEELMPLPRFPVDMLLMYRFADRMRPQTSVAMAIFLPEWNASEPKCQRQATQA